MAATEIVPVKSWAEAGGYMELKETRSTLVSFGIRYGTAVLAVGVALSLTLLIGIFIKSIASPLFLLAIMVVAWKHGIRPGIVATVISGICIDYFFVTPVYQLGGSLDNIVRLVIFTAQGWAFCWLITSRNKALRQINESRDRLQALSLRQQTLREEERKRISLEIHDELGQALTGMKLETHSLSKKILAPGANGDNDETSQRISDLLASIDSTIGTVRRIATELRPPILDDLGLVAAIEWQAQEFQRRTGITCLLSANVEKVDLDAEFTTAVFRIFQETLTNITRHASANTVTVNLRKLRDKLILKVEDDGSGIKIENIDSSRSLGILGMRERARLIGGELEVFNGEKSGATVLLTASLAQKAT